MYRNQLDIFGQNVYINPFRFNALHFERDLIFQNELHSINVD